MRILFEYNDDICCDDAIKVIDDEICDTYGGDYTSQNVYVCTICERAFIEYFGGRFNGVKEVTYKDGSYEDNE